MEKLFIFYLLMFLLVAAIFISVSTMYWFDDDKKEKAKAKKLSYIAIFSPFWPIMVVYGLYKYVTKIVMYREE